MIVALPDYFEALNRDFRHQLTVIGQFAHAIVAEEIRGNRFTIRTNRARVKVSWQITGVRHDAYANAHLIPVEEEAPRRTGALLASGVVWGRRPRLLALRRLLV